MITDEIGDQIYRLKMTRNFKKPDFENMILNCQLGLIFKDQLKFWALSCVNKDQDILIKPAHLITDM